MVQLIIGNKGKGKTKCLLDKVNSEVKSILGSIVYLDKSGKHMFELNNKVRLINVSDAKLDNTDQFLGFVSGIISQDHDLEQVYFDSFLDIAFLKGAENDQIVKTVRKIEELSKEFNVDFVVSVSLDEADLPEELKANIAISL